MLLHSGRWDADPTHRFGQQSGQHAVGAGVGRRRAGRAQGQQRAGLEPRRLLDRAGDAHVYPATPHTPQTRTRSSATLGRDTKPVFLSEYGIGSLMNVIERVAAL